MSARLNQIPTVGTIARRLNTSIHNIEYLIRSRGIEPTGWAGNARIFSDADVTRIASELKRIDAEKAVRS